MNKKRLYEIIDSYWADYVRHKELEYVISPSVPVIWFGDLDAYFRSNVKTVTVSINPSCMEFHSKDDKPAKDAENIDLSYRRFRGIEDIVLKESLKDEDKEILINGLNGYFKNEPYYKEWFTLYEEKCMAFFPKEYAVGYGVAEERPNTAVHIDAYSSLATFPNWSELENKYGKSS